MTRFALLTFVYPFVVFFQSLDREYGLMVMKYERASPVTKGISNVYLYTNCTKI